MPPKAMFEAQMRKIIRDQVAASMAEFMANMNRGAGGAEAGGAEADGAGAGGAEAGGAEAGGAEVGGAEQVVLEITGCTYVTFMKCNPQPFKGTEGRALTWWNGRIASMGIDAANEPEQVKVEQYICGLSKNIRGDVTSSRPTDIDEAKGEGDHSGHGDNQCDYNRRQNQRRANPGAMTNAALNDNEVCPKCKNKKHAGDYWKCGKC
nr:hypothetical protein [Tanacetum cinerariifolium]